MSRFIIKVQQSLYTNLGQPQCMIYNEDQTVMYQMAMNEELSELMGGQMKIFRWAEMVGTEVDIQEEAPWQRW